MTQPAAPTTPIIPGEFSYGVKVVDIGDLRIARGMTRRTRSSCKHQGLVYDPKERRVWCEDCETDVEPFDAFVQLVERYDAFDRRIEALHALQAETLRSRAAKTLDKAFRSQKMIPCCPHCNTGLLPEDVAGGVACMSRDLEVRRREHQAAQGKKSIPSR